MSELNNPLYTLLEKNNCYDITYHNKKFKLLKQTTDNKHLIFTTNDESENKWITKLNHYSVINNPSSDKLLKKFVKLANKYMKQNNVTNNNAVNYDKERKRVKNILNNCNLQLNDNNRNNVKKIFDKEQINDKA